VPSEALIREAMLIFAKMPKHTREQLLTSFVAFKVSKEVEGTSVVMDPKWAKMLQPVMQNEESREAAVEALIRLEKSEDERAVPQGKAPTELTALVFWGSAEKPNDVLAYEYAREIVVSRYGSDIPEIRDFRLVHDTGRDPSEPLTTGVAHLFYSTLLEHGLVTDYGKPNDALDGTTSDGIPFAALFFWHKSKKGGPKKRRSLFRRG
jgi:hypothetical protein